MRWAHANSTGIRRFGFGAGVTGGGDQEPVVEEKTIQPGHGSREFDIVEIDGVVISLFSFVQIVIKDIVFSGHTGTPDLGIRFSTDRGATWLSGASDYYTTYFVHSANTRTIGTYGILANFGSHEDAACFIQNLNADVPTSVVSSEMDLPAASPGRRNILTVGSAVEHNAIQIYIGGGGGTPVFTGGTLDLIGWK